MSRLGRVLKNVFCCGSSSKVAPVIKRQESVDDGIEMGVLQGKSVEIVDGAGNGVLITARQNSKEANADVPPPKPARSPKAATPLAPSKPATPPKPEFLQKAPTPPKTPVIKEVLQETVLPGAVVPDVPNPPVTSVEKVDAGNSASGQASLASSKSTISSESAKDGLRPVRLPRAHELKKINQLPPIPGRTTESPDGGTPVAKPRFKNNGAATVASVKDGEALATDAHKKSVTLKTAPELQRVKEVIKQQVIFVTPEETNVQLLGIAELNVPQDQPDAPKNPEFYKEIGKGPLVPGENVLQQALSKLKPLEKTPEETVPAKELFTEATLAVLAAEKA